MAKFLTELSSLFSQKHFWTLGSLRKTLFVSECSYPRESKLPLDATVCIYIYVFIFLFGSEYPARPG